MPTPACLPCPPFSTPPCDAPSALEGAASTPVNRCASTPPRPALRYPCLLLPAPAAPALSAIMRDMEKSFIFLHDNIPQWLDNVAEIESKIVALQSELSRIPVSRSLPFKKRSGSVESIRDLGAIREEPDASATAAHQSEPTARKRKEPSLLSGHQSGPSKLRSRTMIVVNYDGQIQTSFELLVRAIGTGRNMLRKGKMAAKMEAMAAMAGSSSSDEDDDESNAIMTKIGYRHRGLSSMRARATMRMPENTPSTPVERFDTADKALEEAQALCERAAHQSLREGDCRKELGGVRRYLNEVVVLAKTQVAQYAAQKLVADEKEQQQVLPQGPTPERQSPIPLPDVEKESIPIIIPPAISTNNTSKVIDIEIDDEEDSDDGSFVMPPVRLTSRA
ncbi:hypothetical protein P171DRAFT_426001 [Karstenula rhodostoma CBS 690.94]|uniref:Uncharacterized protein n=1 Tax=Karstenula rhodostoma CBS 690.94 TaxID=1392251 RepID=A0A9P4PWD9_9PLEO|nr:hypothetical protein P171DRAFT_426001 [Karstenula rhodostoma CBS 690.94]